VEQYLGTSSEAEAKRLRHAVVAEILASFERAREGGPIRSDELKAQAEIELRRAYDAMAADFLDSHGRLPDLVREVGEDAADLIGASWQENRLLGKPTTEYAEEIIDRIGAEKTDESVAALSQAILKAHAAAIAMLQRGIEPPSLKGQPVRRKRHGTAPRVGLRSTRGLLLVHGSLVQPMWSAGSFWWRGSFFLCRISKMREPRFPHGWEASLDG